MSYFCCLIKYVVSIHAPVKGATALRKGASTQGNRFNSRSREGSDDLEDALATAEITVSIHAPVKGATMGQKLEDKR